MDDKYPRNLSASIYSIDKMEDEIHKQQDMLDSQKAIIKNAFRMCLVHLLNVLGEEETQKIAGEAYKRIYYRGKNSIITVEDICYVWKCESIDDEKMAWLKDYAISEFLLELQRK